MQKLYKCHKLNIDQILEDIRSSAQSRAILSVLNFFGTSL